MRCAAVLFMLLIGSGLTSVACTDTPRAESGGERGEPPRGPAADPAPSSRAETGAPAPSSPGRRAVPLEIAALVGGKRYQASGLGECEHTTEASIYGVPAALWRASYTASNGAGLRHLNLIIWQPKAGGADQVSLALQVGSTTHQIVTVEKGERMGRGTASVQSGGAAGTLTVEGEDGRGTPVRVAAECSRFREPVAEGG